MKGDNLISGLIRKRRQIGREMAEHQNRIDRLRLDMVALDQVIVLWRPEMDLDAIGAFSTDNRGVRPGDLFRPILAALRMATEPVSLTDLARYVATVRGGTDEPIELYRKRVRRSLDKLKVRGLVDSMADGTRLLWKIAR